MRLARAESGYGLGQGCYKPAYPVNTFVLFVSFVVKKKRWRTSNPSAELRACGIERPTSNVERAYSRQNSFKTFVSLPVALLLQALLRSASNHGDSPLNTKP